MLASTRSRSLPVRFSGKLYPNGEFGISRQKTIGIGAFVRPLIINQFHLSTLELVRTYGFWGAIAVAEARAVQARERSSLTLSNVAISHKRLKVARRGNSGLTRNAARTLRNAAFILDECVDKKYCSFLTVTLPNLSLAERELVGASWGDMTRTFQQRIRRQLLLAGLPGEIFGCTEIQPERLVETNAVYLHLHWVFQGRLPGATWAIPIAEVKHWWQEIVERTIGRKLLVIPRIELVPIRKSIAGYIAKYVSKSSLCVAIAIDRGMEKQLPSSWWLCSQSMKNKINSRVICSTELNEYLMDLCSNANENDFHWLHKIVIKLADGTDICVGFGGKVVESVMEMCKEIHSHVRSLPDNATIALGR